MYNYIHFLVHLLSLDISISTFSVILRAHKQIKISVPNIHIDNLKFSGTVAAKEMI